MRLYCVMRYANPQLAVTAQPGDEVNVDDEVAAQLLRDAPGCWSEKKPTARQVTAANDRMMRAEAAKSDAAETVMTSESEPISRKYKTRGGA